MCSPPTVPEKTFLVTRWFVGHILDFFPCLGSHFQVLGGECSFSPADIFGAAGTLSFLLSLEGKWTLYCLGLCEVLSEWKLPSWVKEVFKGLWLSPSASSILPKHGFSSAIKRALPPGDAQISVVRTPGRGVVVSVFNFSTSCCCGLSLEWPDRSVPPFQLPPGTFFPLSTSPSSPNTL